MDAHSGFVWGLSAPGSIPSLNPAQILPLFMLVWKMLGVLVTDVAKAEQIQVIHGWFGAALWELGLVLQSQGISTT